MKNYYMNYPDQMPAGDLEHCSILFIDGKGVIKNWNKGAENIEGYTPEEIIGTDFRILFTDEDRKKKVPEQMMKDAIKSGKVCQSGWRVKKDGSLFWADAVFTAVFDGHKKIIGFSEIIHDNSEVRNYIDFEQSNLDALINNIKDELWSVDRDYRLITANEAFNKLMIALYGKAIRRGEKLLESNFNADQISRFKEYYDRVFAGESFTTLEITSSPVEYISEISFSPIRKGDLIVGAACRASDITAKRKAELKQQHIDRRFRALIENSKDGIAILTIEGKPIYVSPTVEKSLGYSNEELMQSDLFAIMHPDFIAAEVKEMERCLANPGVPFEGQAVQMRHKDGSWRWMQGVKTNLLHDEAINGIVLNFSDITDIYYAEEKLKYSEARLLQAQEIAHLGTCDINFSTGIAYWSDEHCRIFGLGPGNNLQSYTLWMTFIHPEDFRRVLITIDKAEAASGIFELDYKILLKDQSVRYIHSVCHLETDNTGKKTGLYAVITDETEGKASQQKLMYANRLLSFKSEINKTLGEKNDEQSFLNKACELAVNYGKFDVAWINKPDVVNKKVNFIASYNTGEFETSFFKNFIHYDEIGPTGTVLRTGKPHVVNNFTYWSHYGARQLYAVEKGYKSAIALPIKKSGVIIYTLNLFSKQPGVFNNEEVALLEEAVADISFALDFVNSENLRIETELNLLRSENKFRALIENSDDAMAIFSGDGKLIYVSNSAQKILGYTAEEAKSVDLVSIIHPDFHEQNYKVMQEVLLNPGVPIKRFAKLMQHKNGSWRWIESTMTNLLDEPSVGGIIDNFTDITDRKEAEENLKFSEKRLRQAQEIAHVGSWEIDQSSRIISLSEEACRIYGLDVSLHKITYDEWLAYLHPEESNELLQSMENARRGLTDASFFHKIILKDGTVKHIHMLTHCELNVAGDVTTIYGVSQDITELRLAEEKIKASEIRFRSLIENSSDGVAIFGPDGNLVYIAPTVEEILGYTDTEMLEMDLTTIIHPDAFAGRAELMEKVLANPEIPVKGFLKQMRHKDGRWLWIESTMTNMLKNPAVGAFVDNYRDVTERKNAEERLKNSEKRLIQAHELGHVGNWELDLATMMFNWSEEACRIYGIPTVDNIFTFEEWLTYIHPDDLGRIEAIATDAISTLSDKNFYYKIRRRDGSVRQLYTVARFEINESGNATAVFGAAHDITDLRESEEKLIYSEKRLKEAQELAHVGHWEVDLKNYIISMSEETCRIYGMPPEKSTLLFSQLLNFIHPDDLEFVLQSIEEAKQAHKGFSDFSHRILHSDGSVRYVHMLAHYEMDKEGNPVNLIGTLQDITEIWLAEEKLKASEHRFRSMIENIAGGVMILSIDKKPVYVSPYIKNVLGYTADEFINLDLQELIHPDDRAGIIKVHQEILDNPGKPIQSLPSRRRHRDGSWRWVDTVVTNLLHDPAVKGIVNNFRDVTDKKLADEALVYQNYRLTQAQEIANYGCAEMSYATGNVTWSEQLCNIYGFMPNEGKRTYKDWLKIIHPEDLDRILRITKEADATESNVTFSHRIIRQDGEIRYMHTKRVVEHNSENAPVGIYSVVHDITESVLAEQKLVANEHRFRSLIENSAGGVGIIGPDGKITYVAPSITKVLGYNVEEFMQMDLFSIMHPDDVIPAGRAIEFAFQNPGLSFQGHTGRMKHKDGSWRWIDAIVTNMLHDPAINGIVNNFRDITEKKLADDKLVYANRLYAFISEVNHAIIHNDTEQGLFEEVCRIAIEIGKFRMAWVGFLDENNEKIIPAVCAGEGCDYIDNLGLVIDIDNPKGNGPSGTSIRENRIVYSNNISVDPRMEPWREKAVKHGFSSSVALPLRKGGKVTGVLTIYAAAIDVIDDDELQLLKDVSDDLSFALDIFEHQILSKQLSKKLKQHELLLLRAQEVANFGSYEADFKTKTGVWSEQFCHIYGISPANNVQNYDEWLSFVHPDDKEMVEQIVHESNSLKKNINFHYRIIRSDGSVRHIYSYRQLEYNNNGIPSGAFVVAHDITDEIAHMAQLELQDKQLTEIAWLQSHIVRAPLANILGCCQLVDREKLDPETSDLFNFIYESSEKLDQVIREIVNKARQVEQRNEGFEIV